MSRNPNCRCHDGWVCGYCEQRIDAYEAHLAEDYDLDEAAWDRLEGGVHWGWFPGTGAA